MIQMSETTGGRATSMNLIEPPTRRGALKVCKLLCVFEIFYFFLDEMQENIFQSDKYVFSCEAHLAGSPLGHQNVCLFVCFGGFLRRICWCLQLEQLLKLANILTIIQFVKSMFSSHKYAAVAFRFHMLLIVGRKKSHSMNGNLGQLLD